MTVNVVSTYQRLETRTPDKFFSFNIRIFLQLIQRQSGTMNANESTQTNRHGVGCGICRLTVDRSLVGPYVEQSHWQDGLDKVEYTDTHKKKQKKKITKHLSTLTLYVCRLSTTHERTASRPTGIVMLCISSPNFGMSAFILFIGITWTKVKQSQEDEKRKNKRKKKSWWIINQRCDFPDDDDTCYFELGGN